MKKKIIIISAPSASGKTTFVKYLLSDFTNLGFSISCTTRKPSSNEEHGKDYYFLSKEAFLENIRLDNFIEWEEVYEEIFYGTLKSEIHRLWDQGLHILFDMDVKGAINLKKIYPDCSLSIFIKPPSLEVLSDRISLRSRENLEEQRIRLKKAEEELEFAKYFDEIVLNDKLDQALLKAKDKVSKFLKN